MSDADSFRSWLQQRRKALDLTQADLAERVGCSVDMIYRIEAGTRRPSKQIATRLVSALEISSEKRATFLRLARAAELPEAEEIPRAPRDDNAAPATPPRRHTPIGGARSQPSPYIPVPPSPLVGREREVEEVTDQLLREDVRLLTIVGPAGVGKTRLSLEVAGELSDSFADGARFVPLAAVADIDLVGRAIAVVLGVKESSGETVQQSIVAFLRSRRMLLVLDNFEQVTEAAPLVADLLGACAWLKVLVTSREPLRLRSEWLYDLEGLSYPGDQITADLETYSAVRLFAQRARQTQRRWALTGAEAEAAVRICQLVEGLPLGLELAAATVRERSCVEIARDIEQGLRALSVPTRDLPERHQSIWTALEHSWQLLNNEERQVFPRLSVFRGGFLAEAANEVAMASPSILAALVRKSLVRQASQPDGTRRYTLHELVRQYAAEKLQETGIDEARDLHLSYYLQLAEQAEPRLNAPDKTDWLDRLDIEHDNIRAAFRWALRPESTREQVERALRLGATLEHFWYLHGHWSEGRAWLARALERYGASETTRARGAALLAAGKLANYQSDYAAATEALDQARAVYQALGDTFGEALARQSLAYVAHNQQDFTLAQALWEQVLPVFRAQGDRSHIAQALYGLGYVLLSRGESEAAAQLFDEGLTHYRELGDKGWIASGLTFSGYLARRRGHLSRARRYCEESLAIGREIGNKHGMAWTLRELGTIAQAEGDIDGAAAYIGESLRLRWELRDAHGSAWSLEGLAEIASTRGQPERAARLWGKVEAVREEVGVPRPQDEVALYEGYVEVTRAQTDPESFHNAWDEGRRMPLEDMVAYALEGVETPSYSL